MELGEASSDEAGKVKVHYQGWNKKWDEWIAIASGRVVKDTPENRAAAEEAAKAAKAAREAKHDAKKASDKATKAGKREQDGKDKDGAAPKSKKAKTSSRPAADKKEDAAKEKAPPASALPSEVRLAVDLSTSLKRELISGWEKITREGKLATLPRVVTAAEVLRRYADDATARAKTPEQSELASEVAIGLRAYFDKSLAAVLLYDQEREQAEKALAGGKAPSEVYGADHLLRLFVKLPDLVPLDGMDQAAVKALRGRLTDFLRWLQRNAAAMFGSGGAQYGDAGEEAKGTIGEGKDEGKREPVQAQPAAA